MRLLEFWSPLPTRTKKALLPLAILVIGVGLAAVFIATAEKPAPLRPTNRVPVISVQVVTKTSASPTLRIFGQVETLRMSELTAGVEADILEVKVLEGESVRRDQEMIVMDDTDAKLEILQRQAELSEIQGMMESDQLKLHADQAALATEQSLLALGTKAVERANRLARSNAGSEASLDQARQDEQRQQLVVIQRQLSIDTFAARRLQLLARQDKARAALKRAERERARTRVTAPFGGRVTAVRVSKGDRAKRDTRLVALYDDSQLELRAQVPLRAIPRLQIALDHKQRITARARHNDTTIQLALHRLSASVAAGQGGIDGFFRVIPQPETGQVETLPVLGDTLEVQVELPALQNVVVVSPDSLYGRERVYLVRDGVLQSRSVHRLGQVMDKAGHPMLILAGDVFVDGDEILNSRLPQAISGLNVRVFGQADPSVAQ